MGNNHATIYGATRSGGYLTDGLRMNGSNNYLGIGDTETDIKTIELIVQCSSDTEYLIDLNGTANIDVSSGMIRANNIANPTIYINGEENSAITEDKINHVVVTTETPVTASSVEIGKVGSNYGNLVILQGALDSSALTLTQIKSRFNSLATLPLYTFDASKYPTSSGWTANVPYSSISISSGEFSFTDDGQLQCDSAGSFSLRNSHPFDADEYIKLTINGTEYAGTGSITQGTVTVSLTQGSNKISVNMGTGDVIDGIDIQFREPVE